MIARARITIPVKRRVATTFNTPDGRTIDSWSWVPPWGKQ